MLRSISNGFTARSNGEMTTCSATSTSPPERAHQMQRCDLDVRTHRSRLRRLDNFRSDILSDLDPPPTTAAKGGDPLLLDLSPERESRAAHAGKGRRKAAAEAVKGARLALRDLQDWKASVLDERAAVNSFLELVDPARAFVVGASCHGDGGGGDGGDGGEGSEGGAAASCEVDVVVADPAFLAAEGGVGAPGSENARLTRHASWTGTGAETDSDSSNDDSRDGSVDRVGGGGGGGAGGGRVPAAGFLRALAALDPCVSALRDARSSAKSGDRLGMALETLREHVKVTLIDLMDLETSIPGEVADSSDGEEMANGGGGGGGDKAPPAFALSAGEAAALDAKVAVLVRRLSGSVVTGGGDDGGRGAPGPPSLASVYEGGLRGAAEASEAEVDTTESLTARAVCMVTRAVTGPLLWALDDAYQVRGGLAAGGMWFGAGGRGREGSRRSRCTG